jgi:hypothetical protein
MIAITNAHFHCHSHFVMCSPRKTAGR